METYTGGGVDVVMELVELDEVVTPYGGGVGLG